jgi:hypothetical protein
MSATIEIGPGKPTRCLTLLALLLGTFLTFPGVAQQCQYQTISCGNSVNQRLENSSCQFSDGQRLYGFYFNAVSGQVLDIFLESNAFPPLLVVYGPDSSSPLIYDDGISIAYVQFDVPRTGTYRIVAAADNGSASGLFELSVYCKTVCRAPFSNSPTESITVQPGGQATISFAVDGTPPMSWRWYNTADPFVTLSTSSTVFTTPPVFTTTTFGVAVTNACGTFSREPAAIVTVAPCTAPSISSQPASVIATPGTFVELKVTATGTNLTYQWYRGPRSVTSNPVPFLGSSSPSYTLVAEPRHEGDYWVRVSNTCGSVDSASVRIDVASLKRRAARH